MDAFAPGHKPAREKRAPAHFACCTAFTRAGQRNMKNRKPFRTKRQKAMAKRMARKGDDGAFPGDFVALLCTASRTAGSPPGLP